MKPVIAFFGTKPYDEKSFNIANELYGFDIRYYKGHLNKNNLILTQGADVVCIFVNDTADKDIIDAMVENGVKLLALRNAGFNNVDLKAAEGKLKVVRVPAYSPYAVAEYAVALMLTLNRKIHRAYWRTRDGNFSLHGLMGFDMHGKTVGIIGTGKIAKILIRILKGFGMNILANDLYPDYKFAQEMGITYTSLDELYHNADIISLHCPLTDETKYIINADSISKMKDGVMLINTGRGMLIHTNDLIEGLKNKKIVSVIYKNNGKEVELKGDIFISSMPLKDLVASMDETVPKDIRAIAEGLPYRDFVTVGLLVDHLNLKNLTKIRTLNNIVPDCWIYVQDTGVKLGRIQIFNNWSPYLVEDVDSKVWIGLEYFCNEGDSFWNLSEEKCVRLAAEELIRMGVINRKEDVLDSHREKVKKAYPAYFDTYSQIDQLISYLNGFENLYCVGRNGQHRYNNMDHSMVTAFETVKNILTGEKSRENIWNVNTEKEYHEEKA